jgi:hypothetical protein
MAQESARRHCRFSWVKIARLFFRANVLGKTVYREVCPASHTRRYARNESRPLDAEARRRGQGGSRTKVDSSRTTYRKEVADSDSASSFRENASSSCRLFRLGKRGRTVAAYPPRSPPKIEAATAFRYMISAIRPATRIQKSRPVRRGRRRCRR